MDNYFSMERAEEERLQNELYERHKKSLAFQTEESSSKNSYIENPDITITTHPQKDKQADIYRFAETELLKMKTSGKIDNLKLTALINLLNQ